ncbi:phosphatase PAP2 family protein [Nocardioides campestrisoli]|uniref:phosphatase PAP2 family protein n=1 Tax=Nocardioides campestrisoli TaxID=2736757 RepID=UPI0015E76C27|nr:phosphatase PAP2 family protein [Nocardioides campestrisoli]
MYRRSHYLLIGVAATMGVLAVVAAIALDRTLVDPDGFLGPSWARLPLLLGAALLADMLPRFVWAGRGHPGLGWQAVRERWRTHWNRERLTLVVMGVVCFYITYVSYRNLKSFLPFIMGDTKYDRELHVLDRALFLGTEPAEVLHAVFGTGISAHVLSTIYLWFLPLVPIGVAVFLVWSRNIAFGYWFANSQVLIWTLGTASYYALPTLGPGFRYPWLYQELPETGTSALMEALFYGRKGVIHDGIEGAVQSVAGFASLHTGVTLLVALMIQYTMRNRIVKIVFWVNFGVTVIATLYFGWHYVADDLGGVAIALVSFYLGGLAAGQKFTKRGLRQDRTPEEDAVPTADPS